MVISKVKTTKRVIKPSATKKLYADYRDIQKNAPRKIGQKATTKAGIAYVCTQVTPPTWKRL